jgi:hypothetical protein
MVTSARGLAFTLKGNASASYVEVRQDPCSLGCLAHCCFVLPYVRQLKPYPAVDLDLRLFVAPGIFKQQCVSSYKSYKGACPFSGLMRMVACQLSPATKATPA